MLVLLKVSDDNVQYFEQSLLSEKTGSAFSRTRRMSYRNWVVKLDKFHVRQSRELSMSP